MLIESIASVLLAYLISMFPTAYVVSLLSAGVAIRSENPGTLNTYRPGRRKSRPDGPGRRRRQRGPHSDRRGGTRGARIRHIPGSLDGNARPQLYPTARLQRGKEWSDSVGDIRCDDVRSDGQESCSWTGLVDHIAPHGVADYGSLRLAEHADYLDIAARRDGRSVPITLVRGRRYPSPTGNISSLCLRSRDAGGAGS